MKRLLLAVVVVVAASGCQRTCKDLTSETSCTGGQIATCQIPGSVNSDPVCECRPGSSLRAGSCVQETVHERNDACCSCLDHLAVEPGSLDHPAPGCYRPQQNGGVECVDALDSGQSVVINVRSDGVDSCLTIFCPSECAFLSR